MEKVEKNESLLRLPAVLDRVGLSRATIYRLIDLGEFPRQISLSRRTVAWATSEVDEWIEARISARAGGGNDA